MASIFRRRKKEVSKAYSPTVWVGGAPVVFYNYGQEDFVKKGYAENAEVYSIIKKITDTANIATPYIYVDKEGVKSRNRQVTEQTYLCDKEKHEFNQRVEKLLLDNRQRRASD